MLFCQHSSTENGLFIGKLDTDVLGNEIVTEFVPKEGINYKDTSFIVIDFNAKKAWKLNDDWIKFTIIRVNGPSHRPNIIASTSNYRNVLINDYVDNIKYRNSNRRSITNEW